MSEAVDKRSRTARRSSTAGQRLSVVGSSRSTASYRPYIIARSGSNRPLTQHIRRANEPRVTLCGRTMAGWRIQYMDHAIPLLECMSCKKLQGLGRY